MEGRERKREGEGGSNAKIANLCIFCRRREESRDLKSRDDSRICMEGRCGAYESERKLA